MRIEKVGAIVQGLVLGVLLFLAILELFNAASGGRLFRYEGF